MPTPPSSAAPEMRSALARVVYSSPRSSFRVAEFIDTATARRFKAAGEMPLLASASPGDVFRLNGHWEESERFGTTLKVERMGSELPESTGAFLRWLADQLAPVTPEKVRDWVTALGARTPEEARALCVTDPTRVRATIGREAEFRKFCKVIAGAELRDALEAELEACGLPRRVFHILEERFGPLAQSVIRTEPWRLAIDYSESLGPVETWRACGAFARRAADVARNSGDPARVLELGVHNERSEFRAAVVSALRTAALDGHCALPRAALVEATLAWGRTHCPDAAFIAGGAQTVLSELRALFRLERDVFEGRTFALGLWDQAEPLFQLPRIDAQEEQAAEWIARAVSLSASTELNPLAELLPEEVLTRLSDEQKSAVAASLSAGVMVLTGGPGCGKTFTLRAICAAQRKLGRRLLLCAPTGLAAKRMTASIGEPAYTIHKVLGLGAEAEGERLFDDGAPAGGLAHVDLCVVDESSMLSLDLLCRLLRAGGPETRYLFVGDAEQLPSIGPGDVLSDLISSSGVATSRLTRVFRQASGSSIPTVARAIIRGDDPELPLHTLASLCREIEVPAAVFLESSAAQLPALTAALLTEFVAEKLSLDPLRQAQVLVPMRKGTAGQDALNPFLQASLNALPPHATGVEIRLPENGLLRVGDKALITRNLYHLDLFNGDIGICVQANGAADGSNAEAVIDFDGRRVSLRGLDLEHVELCYAMTIHKSQGSEFPVCIVPVLAAFRSMSHTQLLYTAATRAARCLVLVGQRAFLREAVATLRAPQRHTGLGARLRCRLAKETPISR